MLLSITAFLPAHRGHFLFESGHHGDWWLELDSLWLDPERLAPAVAALARRLVQHRPEALCGPQTGGARLAQLIAAQLDLPCYATERNSSPSENSDPAIGRLFPATYALAPVDRVAVRDQRLAVVDDVINAGSAVRSTLDELIAGGARPVALGALLVLNDPAAWLAARHRLPLESLDRQASNLWEPAACPLCARRVPLTTPG